MLGQWQTNFSTPDKIIVLSHNRQMDNKIIVLSHNRQTDNKIIVLSHNRQTDNKIIVLSHNRQQDNHTTDKQTIANLGNIFRGKNMEKGREHMNS